MDDADTVYYINGTPVCSVCGRTRHVVTCDGSSKGRIITVCEHGEVRC